MACEFLFEGNWYTEDELRTVFAQQTKTTQPSKASKDTIKKLKEFLDRIGVNVEIVGEITYNGKSLGINGIAFPMQNLIQVAQGKEDIALSEEAMHMAVELIEQTNPKLFKEMMDRVGRYNLFDRVMAEYKNNPFYQKDGQPNILKIKKEAIGKILAQTVINKNEDANEKPELLDQTRNWWQKIIDFLKGLFLKAGFNPFQETASQVLSGELGGSVNSRESAFASRDSKAINATLKLVQSLRDPRAAKWFDSLYKKGQKDVFFMKLQQDLQAPKGQVDLLKKWIQSNDPQSVGDMIAGILSELSYTVEVAQIDRLTSGDAKQEVYEDTLSMAIAEGYSQEEAEKLANDAAMDLRGLPSTFYSSLNVPGGTNYRENEIKTPGITPSIKGHAAFASDRGIGWFRSDDMRIDDNTGKRVPDGAGGLVQLGQVSDKKTRRILELQSDLFQKGRDRETLTLGETTMEDEIRWEDGGIEQITEDVHSTQIMRAEAQNNFLQLLNKENNWVTFFVKAIIQDSAKKGYENVRFPGGKTANKIEGQHNIDDFISQKKERIAALEKQNSDITDSDKITRGGVTYIREGENYYEETTTLDREDSTQEFFIRAKVAASMDISREISQLQSEIQGADEGNETFVKIANFYENTIHNILKKQGYNPQEVTDEYGNKWFEVKLNDTRDLGEFYFQISGTQDLAEKIKAKDANITKKGSEYEINGDKIKYTVQTEVEDFYEGRLGANGAQSFFKDFKRETESKVQVDIKDILNRRLDENGKLRITPEAQSNPSAVDPNDNSFYQTLDSHIEQRLSTYEPGTLFLNAPNLYDGKTAGTPDLIAIMPNGLVDVLQFKAVEASRTGDVKVFQQQAYNTEIEAFRRILERGYGIKRQNFRFTRAIPIKADYEPIVPGFKEKKLSKITVGSTDVKLIKDETLLPIASKSESTGNKKFDSYINRLKALVQTLASERVAPEKRLERAQRVASLVAAIKKLQIRNDASGVLTTAKTVIKAQKEKYKVLQNKLDNTNPDVATIAELNKLSNDILDDKDQIQVYTDMYQIFKTIFDDGTADSQEVIKEAREISEDARDIEDNYLELAVYFRTKKYAAKMSIRDEFNPEKKITWYRRMVRSLSQSSLKAGAELWKLVERINNKFELQFLDRLKDLTTIEKGVKEWLNGRSLKDLYSKIFQYDDQGRWNGRVIQKFSKEFYSSVTKALENRDMKWVKDNIDIDEYNKWFVAEHQKLIDNAKTARVHEDNTENTKLVQQSLQDFVDTFNINFIKGIGTKNDKLKNFPLLSKWKSAAYQELEKSENKAVLDLYEYWEKRLKESWDSGMFHEYVGKDWFPNVRRGFLEKMTTAKAGGKLGSLLGNVRIDIEDQVFGKIDPISGKPADEIHALFVRDLGKAVQDTDGNYFKDYSEKSMDIFKVIGLWDAEILKFQLRTESEGIARLLYYTEQNKKILPTTPTGKLLRNKETGEPIEPIEDDTNAKYLKEHIDAVYYGKKRSNEFDVAFNIPYKAAVEKINKLFGKEMLTVPVEDEIRVSGTKMIEAMNRYFVTKTLGLNLLTSFAQLFGGTTNVLINQGIYFNKKDIAEAELKYVSNKFWSSEEDQKLAGLIGFIHPFLEDRKTQELRKLSVSGWVKYLSSDHLFFLQRGSDNWVNTIVGISMIYNTMVVDGKIVNIRDYARQELGHANKYAEGYEASKAFDDKLEARVAELKKSPQALLNFARIENDKMVIDGVERTSDTMLAYRQRILEIIKDALGNVSSEDLALYKRSIVGQSFFMFKNWIPRMADVRFQSLKYSPGTQKYEYGRVRMLWNAVLSKNRSSILGLLKLLTVNNSESIIETAKKEYEKKKDLFTKELDELEMTEAEFVDMYIKGVRAEMKEVLYAVSMMALLISARSMEPDNDPEIKGAYKWALRGIDKLTDELTFMYSPTSFTSILNGSVFPAVGVLVEAQRFFSDLILKLYYKAIGDDEAADRKKVSKHLFRMLPITKELITYVAIFNDDMAKDFGVRINTNYGSIR